MSKTDKWVNVSHIWDTTCTKIAWETAMKTSNHSSQEIMCPFSEKFMFTASMSKKNAYAPR